MDGVWTPVALPWVTLTVTDMDGPKPDSERLTSVDHTRFSAGENVTVSELGEGVAFTNTFGELTTAIF